MRHKKRPEKARSCTGKERIASKGQAVGKAIRLKSVTGARRMSAYKCRFCGGWHVGH